MNEPRRLSMPRLRTALLAAVLLTLAAPWNHDPAQARVPETPEFGPLIEDYANYDPQDECKPKPKPGVKAFRNLVLATYPTTLDFGISRDCDVGGTSEHKEGRAWDWGVDATNPQQKQKASNLLDWLFKTDQYGNKHAIARRVGVMYIVWNKRIWGAWGPGWDTYCVMEDGVCRDPDSGAVRHPHRDHMHISFSWKGARENTTFWNPQDSYP
jgi:hypothetical protein